jgi:hypothetical protein
MSAPQTDKIPRATKKSVHSSKASSLRPDVFLDTQRNHSGRDVWLGFWRRGEHRAVFAGS